MRGLWIAAIALAGLGACKKDTTTQDVIKPYRARLEPLCAKLAGLEAQVATAPLPAANQTKFDPPMVFTPGQMDEKYLPTSSGNTIVANDYELDPTSPLTPQFPTGDLQSVCKWLPEPAKKAGPGTIDSMKPTLASAVETRYAVVVHDLNYVDPKITKQPGTQTDAYTPGSVDARVFIIDLTTGAILHGFDVRAETPDSIKFSYNANDTSASSGADDAVHQVLHKALADQVKAKLAPLGTFKFTF
jgi:hypothetical protein